jgi:hypothetical protein
MRSLFGVTLQFGLCVGCSSHALQGPGTGGTSGAGGETGQAANPGGGGEAGQGGQPDANVACIDAVTAFCDAVYACLSADELFALELPETVDGCVSDMSDSNTCAAAAPADFCGGGGSYDVHAAVGCAQESKAASCEDVQSGDEFAPSCNRVCVEP